MAFTSKELRSAIEAILLASGEPVTIEELVEVFAEEGKEAILESIAELIEQIDATFGGFVLESAAGGYRLATRPEHDSTLRKFFSRQNEGRLSIAALETLAIVAYRQPITAPEISDIRGVNVSGVLRTLLERRMLRIAGRKNVVGSPFLYRTTKEFLTHFGLNSVQDLPRLEEFADILGEQLGEELLSGPMPDMEEGSENEESDADRQNASTMSSTETLIEDTGAASATDVAEETGGQPSEPPADEDR